MARNPFVVEPEEKKIELPPWTDASGRVWAIWIVVRRELTVGEHKKMMRKISSVTQQVAQVRGATPPPAEARLEWTEYSVARFEAYVIDWSLAHEPESKLPPTAASFEKLHRDLAEMIDNAVDAHEQEVAREKKATATEQSPSAISA